MAEGSAERRLAAIVAIDIAGYSARTQADEGAAAAEVAALRARIENACARFGGRLFNSAGDGFMLEFPTASGAVDAAEELIAVDRPPIRVGVHLVEVQSTALGDLLGHGVNVAARIQALASPGSVLVSDDIRRAVRSVLAHRFIAQGAVRLDKMNETVKVFGLGRIDAAGRARLSWRRFRMPLGAAALVILVVLSAAWLWRGYTAAAVAAQARVAILPFDVHGEDPLTKSVASELGDEISTVLNGAQFVTIGSDQTVGLRGSGAHAAAARLGAAFLMVGSVTHEGKFLRVHVRLDDARAGVTIWSDSASALDTESSALAADVAARATNIAIRARLARRSPGGNVEPGVLAEFLKADNDMDFMGYDGSVRARGVLQQVAAQAPEFARGRSSLALAEALTSRWAPPDQHDILVRAARVEAARAEALDPHSGEPYLALYQMAPWRDWVQRERIMLQGMSVEPDYQRFVSTRSIFLGDVGRIREAVAVGQRAVAANALDPHSNQRYANVLAEAGQFGAARAAADQTVRIRPDDWTDLTRLSVVMLYGSTSEAQALLDQSTAHPYPGEAPALGVWSAFLKARQSQAAGDQARAVLAIEDAVRQGALMTRDAIPALCVLGDVDAAMTFLPQLGNSVENLHIDFLWTPAATPLRRDPRFWAFAAKAGLTDYWRTTGRWPDVCQGPNAPSGCKASGAPVTAGRT